MTPTVLHDKIGRLYQALRTWDDVFKLCLCMLGAGLMYSLFQEGRKVERMLAMAAHLTHEPKYGARCAARLIAAAADSPLAFQASEFARDVMPRVCLWSDRPPLIERLP